MAQEGDRRVSRGGRASPSLSLRQEPEARPGRVKMVILKAMEKVTRRWGHGTQQALRKIAEQSGDGLPRQKVNILGWMVCFHSAHPLPPERATLLGNRISDVISSARSYRMGWALLQR